MSIELEYLQRERWDILTHIQAFPGDPYAAGRLAAIEQDIEIASSIPLMGHMAKRLAKATFFKKDGSIDRVVHSDGRGNIVTVIGDGSVEVKPPVGMTIAEAPAAPEPRYTFGADYEQDQLWLAAEREKTKGVREEQRTTVLLSITQEADLYAFPTMAFNLTSMHNLNYGVSRY